MGTIILELPKDLEEKAEAAGLLTSEAFAAMLRENLRRHHLRELLRDAREMAAGDIPPMTMEEIQEEVNAVRVERRAHLRAAADWFPRALEELDAIDEQIKEDGFRPVNEIARAQARRVLLALSSQPLSPNVYPTEDGEISLSFKAPDEPKAFQVVLDNKGGAAWFSASEGKVSYGRHLDAADLPIEFLVGRLRVLGAASGNS